MLLQFEFSKDQCTKSNTRHRTIEIWPTSATALDAVGDVLGISYCNAAVAGVANAADVNITDVAVAGYYQNGI